jgi:ubiquitin
VPSQSKIEPSPEPKSTGTPTPKTSKSPSAKTEAKLCRTIKQFGEEKQCFKLSETTQLTVESRYGDCPVVAASNGTCDIGTIVIVPTDRGAVIKPCSPGGDIKYSVNGNIGGIIGGGEPSSLRNETCLTKSNNTNPYILNYFPPLSFLPNVVSDVRYLLPEIGVEVFDEYVN